MALTKRRSSGRFAWPSLAIPRLGRVQRHANALQREDRERFYLSIRFRLTAWYALILVVMIASLAFATSQGVARSLQNETDDRLATGALSIQEQTDPEIQQLIAGKPPDQIDTEPLRTFLVRPPDVDELFLTGMWVQYFNSNGTTASWDADETSEPETPKVIFPQEVRNLIETSSVLADVLATGEASFETFTAGGTRARVLISPLTTTGDENETQVLGALVVGLPLETQERSLAAVNRLLFLLAIAGVGLAAWAGWMIAGRALAPVKRMTDVAADIASQPTSTESLATRIDLPKTSDEVTHLAATFNTMLSRIEAAFIVQRRFVADASHELRTPLTAIRGNVDVLLRQARSGRTLNPELLVESLDDVHRESSRMARLIDDLLTLARSDSQAEPERHRSRVHLDRLAEDAYTTLEPIAAGRNLALGDLEPVRLLADGDQIIQVMIILGENAIRHTPEGGTVEISVDREVEPSDGRTYGRIKVRDTGEGIAEEHLPHLFERFYRADGSRERTRGGTGLGLSIALGIVRAHGGWIDVETAPGMGSTFTVYLPEAE